MRATRAYITGFGTTGLLIASAFLTLLVMSAYVAFNGFPGQSVEDPIGTLLIPENQTTVKVPPHVLHVRAATGVRAGHASSVNRAHIRGGNRPRAGTGPVNDPTSPQLPASTQGPSSTPPSSGSSSLPGSVAPQLPPGTPSLPTTPLPVPQVTVPSVPSLPATPTVPVDTSGVTGLLGGH